MTSVSFSIISHAAWTPSLEAAEPTVTAMPALLRRRASTAGKMALEVAYRCLGDRNNIPSIFCSRHGECARSADLLTDLAHDIPISPTAFSLSVHNANGGLFSIARHDHANHLAIAAGQNTIENAVIEACGLLADGEPTVLLVAYDNPPPAIFTAFQDCNEQPYAWAWLMESANNDPISLSWSATQAPSSANKLSNGLEVLQFFISNNTRLERISNGQCWQWKRHV